MPLYLFYIGRVTASGLINRSLRGMCLLGLLQSQLFCNTAPYSECGMVAMFLIHAQNLSFQLVIAYYTWQRTPPQQCLHGNSEITQLLRREVEIELKVVPLYVLLSFMLGDVGSWYCRSRKAQFGKAKFILYCNHKLLF